MYEYSRIHTAHIHNHLAKSTWFSTLLTTSLLAQLFYRDSELAGLRTIILYRATRIPIVTSDSYRLPYYSPLRKTGCPHEDRSQIASCRTPSYSTCLHDVRQWGVNSRPSSRSFTVPSHCQSKFPREKNKRLNNIPLPSTGVPEQSVPSLHLDLRSPLWCGQVGRAMS